MSKSFSDVEQDLRFQLDLVRLAASLGGATEASTQAANHHAGVVEELVRVQRESRTGGQLSA
jgi:hypothetical protein